MSIDIIVEVMDRAPASLTPQERVAAMVFAEDANKDTRELFHPLSWVPFQRRIGVSSEKKVAELAAALARKGVLQRVARGQKYRAAEYRFALLALAQQPGIRVTEPESTEPQQLGNRVAEQLSATQYPGLSHPDTGLPIPSPLLKSPPSLSPLQPDLPTVDAPAPPRERTESGNDTPAPAQTVLDAYAQALGRPVTNGARTKLLGHAQSLLAAGYPAAWLADRAREMAAKGWTDLEQHAERSTVPLPRPARPPWCGQCDENSRLILDKDGYPLRRCPTCRPAATPTTRQPAEQPDPHEPDEPRDPTVRAFTFLTSLPAPWTLGRSAATILNAALADAVAAHGWDFDDDLTKRLTEGHGIVTDHAAALRGRVLALATMRADTQAPAPPPANTRPGLYRSYQNPVDQSVYLRPIA